MKLTPEMREALSMARADWILHGDVPDRDTMLFLAGYRLGLERAATAGECYGRPY